MNPPGVVKIHIMLDAEAELRQTDILFDFDVLIFQRPPEALHLCIVQATSPPVHADLNTMGHIFKNQEISLFYNMLIINAISGDT